MKILEMQGVGLTYFSNNGETKALENLTFSIDENEFVSIVGPSGCGKTSILSLISGLLKPTKGKILLYGKPIENINQNVGYMFQKDELFEWRSILENIYLGLEIQHKLNNQTKDYVKNLLKKYGLWDFRNHHPSELSGGMRQRVALIRTLALQPKILLLDEAFSALDYQTRLNVCDDVYDIIKEEKLTAILVTHDITEAIAMADVIYLLSNRPSTIIKKYDIDLGISKEEKTPLKARNTNKFHEYFALIWNDMNK